MGVNIPSVGRDMAYSYAPVRRTGDSGTVPSAALPGPASGQADTYVPSDNNSFSNVFAYGPSARTTPSSPDASVPGAGAAQGSSPAVGASPSAGGSKAPGDSKCKTCAERTYKDGSNDPGVSFKAATHVSPEAAATAVSSHESEHVSREQMKAKAEDKVVVSQTVQIHTSVCPECGRVYVSGGTTTTTTKNAPEEPQQRSGINLTV